MEFIDIFVVLNYFYPDLELDPFQVETKELIFLVFSLFFGLRFPGVKLALVSPVNPELVSPVNPEITYRSVRSVSTTITSCASASD